MYGLTVVSPTLLTFRAADVEAFLVKTEGKTAMKKTHIAVLLGSLIVVLSLTAAAENVRRPEKSSRSADDHSQPTAIDRKIGDYRQEQTALRDDLARRLAEHEEATPEQV